MSHTPGPWTVDSQNGQLWIVGDPRDNARTIVAQMMSANVTPATDANARLIAAAPDMLAALQWAMEHAEWSNDIETGTDPIRLAIAKATSDQNPCLSRATAQERHP